MSDLELPDELLAKGTHRRSLELPEPLHFRADGSPHGAVEGWIVPFDAPAKVFDVVDGRVHRYVEGFRRGSFTAMEQAAHARGGRLPSVRLSIDHEQGYPSMVGVCSGIRQDPAKGAWASFDLIATEAEKVRSMVELGYDGFSIEFVDRAKPEIADGVVWRRSVHLSAVTLTPDPAYIGAKVLAMRGDDTLELATPALDDTLAWLSALG